MEPSLFAFDCVIKSERLEIVVLREFLQFWGLSLDLNMVCSAVGSRDFWGRDWAGIW